MIDALIGSVIAVAATAALALLVEVVSASKLMPQRGLTIYEKRVVHVVAASRGFGDATGRVEAEQQVVEIWLNERERSDP